MPIGVHSTQPGSPSPWLRTGVDDRDAIVAIDLRGELNIAARQFVDDAIRDAYRR